MVVFSLPFSSGIRRTSRKDMEPSSLGSSLVKCMLASNEFEVVQKGVFVIPFDDGKGIINIPFPQGWGVRCCTQGSCF